MYAHIMSLARVNEVFTLIEGSSAITEHMCLKNLIHHCVCGKVYIQHIETNCHTIGYILTDNGANREIAVLNNVTFNLVQFKRPEWYVFDDEDVCEGYKIYDVVPICIRYLEESVTSHNLWILYSKIGRSIPNGNVLKAYTS